MGVDVGAVVAGEGDAGFEFTREVGWAVDGFGFLVAGAAGELFFARLEVGEPKLVVGGGFGLEMQGDFVGQGLHLIVNGVVFERLRRTHNVAFDVAAGGEGGKLGFVNAANGFFEVRLEDAVELEPLAGGNAQSGVSDLVAKVEFSEQLGAVEFAAGNGRADHEAEGLAFDLAVVAVVLLVGAVVFEQLHARFAEEGVVVGEFLRNGFEQVVAVLLEDFDGTRFFGFFFGIFGHVVFRVYPACLKRLNGQEAMIARLDGWGHRMMGDVEMFGVRCLIFDV